MELTIEHVEDSIHVIRLSGRMDVHGTEDIRDSLMEHANCEDFARIVIDMSDVPYLASLGLGCLIRVAQAVNRREGRVVLLNPQPVVAKVLAETGINQQVHVYDSYPAAARFLHMLPRGEE